tara:strand:- start:1297 stop:1722 length:426 start_codon:yes stop_codon:yes gene_type:complete
MTDAVDNGFAANQRRRECIVCSDNPASDRDYLVEIGVSGLRAPACGAAARGRILLVPDRLIVAPDGLSAYLETLGKMPFASLEAMAAVMFDDLNNQIIPRWLSLILGGGGRTVTLRDCQPNWRNEALLSALIAGGAGLPAE